MWRGKVGKVACLVKLWDRARWHVQFACRCGWQRQQRDPSRAACCCSQTLCSGSRETGQAQAARDGEVESVVCGLVGDDAQVGGQGVARQVDL